MDQALFNSTLQVPEPVVITDLQQAPSNFRAVQIASRKAKNTPLVGLQFAGAERPDPLRGSLDSESDDSTLQYSLASSSSSRETDVGQEIRSSAVAV